MRKLITAGTTRRRLLQGAAGFAGLACMPRLALAQAKGQIVREISALVGGRGGGRADMATGGGTRPEQLDEALAASYETVERMLDAK